MTEPDFPRLFVCVLALVPVFATTAQAQPASWPSAARLEYTAPAASAADVVPLPRPRGPHPVGAVTYHWVLDSPEELTTSPIDRREVIARLFYPAEVAGGGPKAAYVPELPLLRRGLLTHGFPPFADLARRLETYARIGTAASPDAPVRRADGPIPVVLISPGGNMSRHWHTALSQELASQGYAVAVMSHPHSGLDVFPGGGFLASNLYWHPGDEVPPAEVERRDSLLAVRLASDAAAVLDGLSRLAESTEEGLEGALDLERVAIIGHSRGGSTVTAACGGDLRIDACVIFDNIGEVAGMNPRFTQPRLTVRAPWERGRADDLAALLTAGPADAFEVVIPGANHYSFTDLPLVDPEGYPSDGIAPEDAHRFVSSVTLRFLERYLRGGPDFVDAIEGIAELDLRAY